MFMNLQFAEQMATIISLIFAYTVSTSLNGFLQSYIAKKMGDDTPEQSGFLTINPLAHFHPLGFFLLLLTKFGWGRSIPFNPMHIHGKTRMAKVALLFCSEAIISILMAIVALVALVSIFDLSSLRFVLQMMVSENVPVYELSHSYANHSSVYVGLALILVAFVFFNIFMATLSIIVNGLRFFLFLGIDKEYGYMEYVDYLVVLAPLLAIFLFASVIRFYLIKLIFITAAVIATVFGVS
mgnify:CR=1 FL=1